MIAGSAMTSASRSRPPSAVDEGVLDRLMRAPPGEQVRLADVAGLEVHAQSVMLLVRGRRFDVRRLEGEVRKQLVGLGVVHRPHQFINSGISVSRARSIAIARRVRDFTVPMGRPRRAAICDCERSSS